MIDVGLSPLARGTLGWGPRLVAQQRFIPAGAGNTLVPVQYHVNYSVYPRWRGEHTKHT
ncbi:hypothetical protein AD11_2927 [Escherichia coli 1-250-04_S4_C2]|nr:hypothetical protein AD11_2927 [Escherichia coli 1-250-04_S4_C2]